jgi:dipeptidyl aminopeptidase/acylaminoacyl peptidase
MTTNDAFERNLSMWLHEDAEAHVPDHLEEVLQRTAATRQRPAWSSLERWLSMDTTLRPGLVILPRGGRLLLVAAVIIALVAVALIAVGSRPRLPEPFGTAQNGMLVTSRDGDIYLMDPTATDTRLIVGGDGFDFSPIFSRDGTSMVFLRSDVPLDETEVAILTLYVANADGSEPRALTPPTKALDWFDWSPDGTRVAYMAQGALWVVDVAGGEPLRMRAAEPVHFPTWLPPDGRTIVYRRETASPGIWAITADGASPARELSKTAANNQYDYQSIAASPDGAHITFTRWSSAGLPRIFALDVATGEEMAFPTENGRGQRGNVVYSPDGKLVAYAEIFREGAFQVVVANADGSGNVRPIGPKKPGPMDGSDIDAAWAFTPDGTALLVRYGNDDKGATQLLPLDGSPGTELGSGGFEFVDIQRLAP